MKRDGNAQNGTMLAWSGQLTRNAAGRPSGPVEAVIAWAWREELPKAPKAGGPEAMAGGWDKTGRYGEYLSLVELHGVNRYGCVPDFSAGSWPHPDALAISEAVFALDGLDLDMPEDWRPAPELDRFGGLGAKAVSEAWRKLTRTGEDGRRQLRVKPSDLAIRRAVLGVDLAALEIGEVELQVERHGNGMERWFVRRTVDVAVGRDCDGNEVTQPETIEVDGWSARNRRPLPDAYRKPYLDPDPVGAIMARAEHEIWHSALLAVHDAVAGALSFVEMTPTRMTAEPWLEGVPAPRILADLASEARLAEEERTARREALAARFPRWFRNLERMQLKMAGEAA